MDQPSNEPLSGPADIARAQRIFARVYASHARRTKGRVRAKYERRAAEATKRAEAAAAGGEVL